LARPLKIIAVVKLSGMSSKRVSSMKRLNESASLRRDELENEEFSPSPTEAPAHVKRSHRQFWQGSCPKK
jgi:hypothetical protein